MSASGDVRTTTSADEVAGRLRAVGLTVIYRGLEPDRTVHLTRALFGSFEVTMTGGRPLESLRAEFGPEVVVGADTIFDPAEAADAGAEFVVSPHLDPEIVVRTRAAGLASVPGAFTPTDIVAARRAGADLVKIFPVNVVGADYLLQLAGPLPGLAVTASGGLQPDLVRACRAAGAVVAGIGSHLLGADADGGFDPDDLGRRRTTEFLRAAGRSA